MGTLNGARHLAAQLESLVAQTHADWSLRVGDDGSTDDTRAIIEAFARAHPDRDIRLYDGPCRGSAANFLTLLGRDDLPAGGWVALSDQDDVWMPDRLEHALRVLGGQGAGPRAYASRTILTDESLVPLGESRRHPHRPAFGNALVQNVLAGNTIVLSAESAAVLHRTAPAALAGTGVPHHDWWVYLLLSGVGASIINDDRPGVYYRQHDANLLGAHRGLAGVRGRFSMIWNGRYGDWIGRNLVALNAVSADLTEPNKAQLLRFQDWFSGNGRGVLGGGMGRTGAWRQTRAENLLLRLAAASGRL